MMTRSLLLATHMRARDDRDRVRGIHDQIHILLLQERKHKQHHKLQNDDLSRAGFMLPLESLAIGLSLRPCIK